MPTDSPDLADVLTGVNALTQRVRDLDKHIRIAEAQAKETTRLAGRADSNAKAARFARRWALGVGVFALLVSLAGIGYGVHVQRSIHHNAVVACQNGNERSTATLRVWDVILNASAAQPDDPHPARTHRLVAAYEKWLGKVFAERDCNNLGTKYKIPDPPKL